MSRSSTLSTTSTVLRALPLLTLGLGLVLAACGNTGGGGEGGGAQSTTSGTGQSGTTSGTGQPGTTSGTGSTSSGGSCDMTDPSGQGCTDTSDCNVVCDCGASGKQTVGECAVGSCGAAGDVCGAACGGDYTGSFCFAGKKMMGCIMNGSHCDFDEDCCSGSCFSGDSTCEDSGACNNSGDPCSFDEDCCSNACGDDGSCE